MASNVGCADELEERLSDSEDSDNTGECRTLKDFSGTWLILYE
jgi:hypothetical protein